MFPAKVAMGLCVASDKGDLCSLSLLLGCPRWTSEQCGQCQPTALIPQTLLSVCQLSVHACSWGVSSCCVLGTVANTVRRLRRAETRATSMTKFEAAGALTWREPLTRQHGAFAPLGSHFLVSALSCFHTWRHGPRLVSWGRGPGDLASSHG